MLSARLLSCMVELIQSQRSAEKAHISGCSQCLSTALYASMMSTTSLRLKQYCSVSLSSSSLQLQRSCSVPELFCSAPLLALCSGAELLSLVEGDDVELRDQVLPGGVSGPPPAIDAEWLFCCVGGTVHAVWPWSYWS